MLVFLGIQLGQVPEEPQQEGLDPFRNWQAACSVPNRLICSVSGVHDPKDFPQTPGVEGIEALSQGLGDGPCLAPIEQDWEDVSRATWLSSTRLVDYWARVRVRVSSSLAR